MNRPKQFRTISTFWKNKHTNAAMQGQKRGKSAQREATALGIMRLAKPQREKAKVVISRGVVSRQQSGSAVVFLNLSLLRVQKRYELVLGDGLSLLREGHRCQELGHYGLGVTDLAVGVAPQHGADSLGASVSLMASRNELLSASIEDYLGLVAGNVAKWRHRGVGSDVVVVVAVIVLLSACTAIVAGVTAAAAAATTVGATGSVEPQSLSILHGTGLFGVVIHMGPWALLSDHRRRRCRLVRPEQGRTAPLGLLQDGRVAELCNKALEALNIGVGHSTRLHVTPRDVVMQESATAGPHEHQQPGCRDEVNEAIADRLVLAKINAVVGEVVLSRADGVEQVDQIALCELRREVADHERGTAVGTILDLLVDDVLWSRDAAVHMTIPGLHVATSDGVVSLVDGRSSESRGCSHRGLGGVAVSRHGLALRAEAGAGSTGSTELMASASLASNPVADVVRVQGLGKDHNVLESCQ
jgi:hypothetical protein